MEKIIEQAYAKINLGLQVCSKREDDFHELQMIMAPIDLFDTLEFVASDEVIINTNIKLNQEDNIVYKVIKYFQEHFDIKSAVKVTIDKQIPLAAGLGGGSSNAAATIRALNILWNLNLSIVKQEELGAIFGSDVSFFIRSLASLVEGRGEILKPLDFMPELNLVLLYPNYPTFTKEVFASVDKYLCDDRIDKLISSLETNDIKIIKDYVFNDLSTASNKVATARALDSPQYLINLLNKYGALNSFMSGSGSTIVSLWPNEDIARSICEYLKISYPQYSFFTVKTKN